MDNPPQSGSMDSPSTKRTPLHQRTESESNRNVVAAIRMVPKTPPRLLGQASSFGEDLAPPPVPNFWRGRQVDRDPEKQKHKPIPATLQLENHEFRSAQAQASRSALSSPQLTHQQSFQSLRSAYSATDATRSPSPTSSTRSHSRPRRKKLQVHQDNKTFSLLEEIEDSKSPSLSFASTKASSHSLLTSDDDAYAQGWHNLQTSCARVVTGSTDPIPSTPASKGEASGTATTTTTTPAPTSRTADLVSNSPWNYQFVGGLRKVPKTPNLSLKQKDIALVEQDASSPAPSLPSPSRAPPVPSHDLATKPSFRSTDSEDSERTNYKVHHNTSASSTISFRSTKETESNYQVHGDPSPAPSVIYRPQTAESDNANYEVYENSSPPAAPYLDLVRHPQYSQDSLIIPPLNTKARGVDDNSAEQYSKSKESLRSQSITSISTVFSHKEALRAVVGRGSQIQLLFPIPKIKAAIANSWAEPSLLQPPRLHMNEHPHQWSSQLSTVLSVSDSGTDRGSRSWSDDNGRLSSNFGSRSSGRASRGRILSISSDQDPVSPLSPSDSRGLSAGLSRLDSYRAMSPETLTEPSTPYFSRPRHPSGSSLRMVQDVDEHGDGITDMQDLRTRPSRRHLSGFFSSISGDDSRTNTMRSTTSTRANSLIASSIPAWARAYYGSGERRYLGAPGTPSEGSNTRASSFLSGSPNTDHFPNHIYSPRRRPREVDPSMRDRRGSLEINPALAHLREDGNDPYSRRFRTWSMSSMWSPHLRHDRRAHRPSVFEPPSVNWSTGGGLFGRRNIQIVMFTLGFIFPFAWMIAALLPLPPQPMLDMEERDGSTSNLDARNPERREPTRRYGPMDEARYESAVWWRKLNRWMSFVGFLILASIIVLVVVGVRENWGLPKSSTN